MHMLEQVQRGAPAAVEQLHIVGFRVERIQPADLRQQGIELGQPRLGQRRLFMQHPAHGRKVGSQLRIRVTQQARQHPQGAWCVRRWGLEQPAHVRSPP